jgi:hypothetical protein
MRQPVPQDWNKDDDGYLLAIMCIPNSEMWRAIIRGKVADLTGFNNWDKKTGYVLPVIEIAEEIFDSMAMCKLDDLLTEFKRLNAILAGEELTIIKDGVTSHWDYTENGLVPTLEELGPATTVAKLEEMRVTLETAASDEVTAINTNGTEQRAILTSLVAAINDLDPYDDVNLVAKLEEVRAMLEERSVAETTAANTRNTALIKAVGEIDATTTVNLNNTNGCGDCGECADCSGDAFSVQVQE